MIAKRIEEARQFDLRDLEAQAEHCGETQHHPTRALRTVEDVIGARGRVQIHAAQFLRVAADGETREFARHRREARVVRLVAQLEKIDELRAEAGVATFQDARRVLERRPAHPRDPAAHRKQSERGHGHEQIQSHAGVRPEVQDHIRDERRQHQAQHPRHAPEKQARATLPLQHAPGGGQLRRERSAFAAGGFGRFGKSGAHVFR